MRKLFSLLAASTMVAAVLCAAHKRGIIVLWTSPQCVGPLPLQLRSALRLSPRVPCRLICLQVRPRGYSLKDEPQQRRFL